MRHSASTHHLCKGCWKRHNGEVESPEIDDEGGACCGCGKPNIKSGIFIQAPARHFPNCLSHRLKILRAYGSRDNEG